LDLFFQYEWNNMLHGLVESIIRTILESESGVLKQSLFVDGKFVDCVLKAYAKNSTSQNQKYGFRLGYMGHLVRTCGAIAYIFQQDAKTKAILGDASKIKEWDDFVSGPLARDNESHNAMLGGHMPVPQAQAAAGGGGGDFDAGAAGGHGHVAGASSGPTSSSTSGAATEKDPHDPESFQFGDDDGYGSSHVFPPAEDDEEWTGDDIPVQFQPDWPDLYSTATTSHGGHGGGQPQAMGGLGGASHKARTHDDESSDEEDGGSGVTAVPLGGAGAGHDSSDEEDFDPRSSSKPKSSKKDKLASAEPSGLGAMDSSSNSSISSNSSSGTVSATPSSSGSAGEGGGSSVSGGSSGGSGGSSGGSGDNWASFD